MDKKNTLIQQEKSNTLKSKITIKLIGDANDLSEIVSDINSEYHLNAEFNKQASGETISALNFEPSKKKLKMKEEILTQRVVLVVPKNSSLHYPSSPKQNLKIKNDQQNYKSCPQNTVEDNSKKNLSINSYKDTNLEDIKFPDLNVNFKEEMKNYKNEHKKLNHNFITETVNSKQTTDSKHLFKQLNEEKNQSIESVCDKNKVQIIEKPFQLEESLTKPLKRKFNVAQNIIHSNTLTQKLKNNLQAVPTKNPTQDTFILNRLTPLKILHSPIVLRKSHPTNYFKQNKLSKKEKKAIENTDSVDDKTIEDNTSLLFDNHIETTDFFTGSKVVNIATENQSSKDIKTYSSLLHKKKFHSSLNSLETNKTTTELSLPEKNSITTKDQEQPPKNTKIDISLRTYSRNSKLSEANKEMESKFQQTVVPLETINSKTIQPALDKKEESLSQELNNHECTNNLKTPENKKYCVSISPNKILHETCDKKQHIKSPQVKVNGLMIRAPDRNLINNPALKEKIQEFRLSNKHFEKMSCILIRNTQHESTEQKNNSLTLPEVSESLVSTTTIESGQSDKNIKDCQCEQLRQEVNEQWEVITNLRSRINKSLNTSKKKCDSFIEEKNQIINDEHVLEMLVKELEETNRKITENLRKEQIRNKKLKLTLKHKNIRIKQLENKLKTVSKIFEETEKSVVCLRNLMQ